MGHYCKLLQFTLSVFTSFQALCRQKRLDQSCATPTVKRKAATAAASPSALFCAIPTSIIRIILLGCWPSWSHSSFRANMAKFTRVVACSSLNHSPLVFTLPSMSPYTLFDDDNLMLPSLSVGYFLIVAIPLFIGPASIRVVPPFKLTMVDSIY